LSDASLSNGQRPYEICERAVVEFDKPHSAHKRVGHRGRGHHVVPLRFCLCRRKFADALALYQPGHSP
jgi:hypothetical protein